MTGPGVAGAATGAGSGAVVRPPTMRGGRRRRVVVADSEPLFAVGVATALRESGAYEVVRAEPAAGRALVDVVASLRPAVIVLDASLGARAYAADLVAELGNRVPETPVVVTVGRARPAGLVEVMDLGARAVVDRQCSPAEVVTAVAAAERGQNWVAAPLASVLRSELEARATGEAPPDLTPREMDVLRGLAAGGTNAGVGLRLGISENTVRNHVRSIMSKLGVRTRTDAVATAVRRGLVEIPE